MIIEQDIHFKIRNTKKIYKDFPSNCQIVLRGNNICELSFASLVGEVNEIQQSVDALKQKLNNAENSLKDLQDNRMALEKEISCKKNSIFIDREKCLTVRNRFPSRTKLQGYQ